MGVSQGGPKTFLPGTGYSKTSRTSTLTMQPLALATKVRDSGVWSHESHMKITMWGPRAIAKLVYNSNNYGL
jgi:hypothetical protein